MAERVGLFLVGLLLLFCGVIFLGEGTAGGALLSLLIVIMGIGGIVNAFVRDGNAESKPPQP